MLAGRRPAQSVIIDAAKRFVVAYNAGDETGLRQLLADDAVFCLGELCVAGRDQVVAHLARSGFLFGKRALVVEGAFNQSGCKVQSPACARSGVPGHSRSLAPAGKMLVPSRFVWRRIAALRASIATTCTFIGV
jgi:hypothetical protein